MERYYFWLRLTAALCLCGDQPLYKRQLMFVVRLNLDRRHANCRACDVCRNIWREIVASIRDLFERRERLNGTSENRTLP